MATEGTENTENQEPGEGTASLETKSTIEEGGQPANDGLIQPTKEELVLEWAKSKGLEISSADDLLKTPEKIVETVEVNPYEKYLSEEDKEYYAFAEKTGGRSRKEFESLKVDYDKVNPLELAREKVKRETGDHGLDNETIDEYISSLLGIDTQELDATDKIKLATYIKDIREEKKAEQQKLIQPITNKQPEAEKSNSQAEYVNLDNGTVMKKSDYDAMVGNQIKHLEDAKAAVNSVTAAEFKVVFDDNGTPKEESYTYDYDEKDRHSMVSIVSDLNGVIAKHGTDKGFDHGKFNENALWGFDKQFREKAIASIVHKAIAKNTEEILAQRGNVNFKTQQDLNNAQDGNVKYVPVGNLFK